MNLLSRWTDKRFSEDLRKNLVRLFHERAARTMRNDEAEYREPRSFDYAVAKIDTPDLNLRFVRVRGELEVDISAPGAGKWDALDSALLWLDMQRGVRDKTDIPAWGYGSDWNSLDWQSIDDFLVENWDRLKAAAAARGSNSPTIPAGG